MPNLDCHIFLSSFFPSSSFPLLPIDVTLTGRHSPPPTPLNPHQRVSNSLFRKLIRTLLPLLHTLRPGFVSFRFFCFCTIYYPHKVHLFSTSLLPAMSSNSQLASFPPKQPASAPPALTTNDSAQRRSSIPLGSSSAGGPRNIPDGGTPRNGQASRKSHKNHRKPHTPRYGNDDHIDEVYIFPNCH